MELSGASYGWPHALGQGLTMMTKALSGMPWSTACTEETALPPLAVLEMICEHHSSNDVGSLMEFTLPWF